jgi:hypothetical protein
MKDNLFSSKEQSEITEADTLLTPQPEIKPIKTVSYQERLEKMSNRQLQGELKRKMRKRTTPRMDDLLANVLSIMLDNHDRGMTGRLG